jgi:glycosyltransferase involved in cell wall biosynthesis
MSNSSGKLLFLSSANPMGIGGGCFASHAYLRAFSEIYDGNVDIIMAEVWRDEWDKNVKIQNRFNAKPLTKFQYIVSWFTGEIQRFSGEAERIIEETHEDYSCVVCNGSGISGRLWRLTKRYGIKLITIHHNFEPEYFADNSKGLHKFLYLPIVRKLEQLAYLNSDYNLFLTKQDLTKFHSVYGENNSINKVIGVFEFSDYIEPETIKKNEDTLTFVITGSLNTIQGVDGIKYFFNELYQYLPEDCIVIISGRNPVEEIEKICQSHTNVKLIPNPSVMNDVIASGDIYICPTRVGGGIKLRIMDGLRLGLPVITHDCSARGYDMFFNTSYLKTFNDQNGFKNAIEEMLKVIKGFSKKEMIEDYKNTFSYSKGLKRIKDIVK